MAIVTLEDMMRQLSLTNDAPADDLTLLGDKIAAAQNHVERLLGFQIEATFGGDGQDAIPPALIEAVKQLAAWWFENREAATDLARVLPFGVSEIIDEFREWSF